MTPKLTPALMTAITIILKSLISTLIKSSLIIHIYSRTVRKLCIFFIYFSTFGRVRKAVWT
jgi:hypothetical protein